MRVRVAGATLVVAALVPLTAWIMAWPLEKAAYLAPVIVVAAAAIVGLLVLLTFLGVKLPREH